MKKFIIFFILAVILITPCLALVQSELADNSPTKLQRYSSYLDILYKPRPSYQEMRLRLWLDISRRMREGTKFTFHEPLALNKQHLLDPLRTN